MINKTQGGFLISQIKHLQGRVGEKILAQARIEEFNGAQGKILYILWQADFVPIVELAKKCTQKGKICLLSPAAASYDQFVNFEYRGNKFKELLSYK